MAEENSESVVAQLREQLRIISELHKESERRIYKTEGQLHEARRESEQRIREKEELFRLRADNRVLRDIILRQRALIQAATDVDSFGDFADIDPGLGTLG